MRQTLTPTPSQPNLVVGWASGLVQVWPAEDREITAVRPARRVAQALGTADAVYELLAAVDGTDETAYRRRHAADVGAVLALTHHTEAAVLRASIQVRGTLSPSAMLALLHAEDDGQVARLAS